MSVDTARVSPISAAPDRRRLTALRLASQWIGGRDGATPGDVVRWMLALQGQDFPGAKWSVGLRQSSSGETAVDAAFHAGEIVRSWPLRGTLHLVTAEDLGWLLALTAPRMLGAAAARRASLGLTDADVERAREVAMASLSGGRVLARRALLSVIARGGVDVSGQRGYHVLRYLAQTGTLVLGAPQGGQQAFALLDEWVRTPRRPERDEALGELAFRFFRSHGPATVRDLARWSALTLTDVRRGLAVCGTRLAALEVDGTTYHLGPQILDGASPDPAVHLLPGFDEYLLGYADRSAVLPPEHAGVVVPGGNGMFRPTIVADGEVRGTWRRTVTAREVVIEPRLFGPLSGTLQDGLAVAAGAYGAYLGRPARLAWGTTDDAPPARDPAGA